MGMRAPTEPRNTFEAFHSCGFFDCFTKVVHKRHDRSNTGRIRERIYGRHLFFSCEVCAGKRAVDCMVFSPTELDENNIENFETVEFSFHIFKTADRNTIDDSKPVVLNFN